MWFSDTQQFIPSILFLASLAKPSPPLAWITIASYLELSAFQPLQLSGSFTAIIFLKRSSDQPVIPLMSELSMYKGTYEVLEGAK